MYSDFLVGTELRPIPRLSNAHISIPPPLSLSSELQSPVLVSSSLGVSVPTSSLICGPHDAWVPANPDRPSPKPSTTHRSKTNSKHFGKEKRKVSWNAIWPKQAGLNGVSRNDRHNPDDPEKFNQNPLQESKYLSKLSKKKKKRIWSWWVTYDEEDLGRSVTVRSVKDFDSIVAELRVWVGLLRPNLTKRHRSARVRIEIQEDR